MGGQKSRLVKRREFLAGLASVPLLGTRRGDPEKRSSYSPYRKSEDKQALRLGIAGYGNRGEELLKATVLTGLNVEFRGICEIFDQRLERGISHAGSAARGYKNYLAMLESDEVDAVIIATPDHWHARMAAEAARRGKHIYLEKCMARSAEEAKTLRDEVRNSGVVFQLGHQGRQRDLNLKARELIRKDTLGQITLIETTTNRNDTRAGWEIRKGEQASRNSIDWDLFQEPSGEKHPFSAERYYGWRNYWAYGTGMSGDLLSNEFDAVNSIMDLGIPESAMASGGLYYHRDGREVPDVFQAAFEYPSRALTLLYSGTLASGVPRGTLIMGREASLELGRVLSVWVDKKSAKYKSRIEAGMIDPSAPLINYTKEQQSVDAISSATEKYYADRGLVTTYRDGKEHSSTQLHLAEWLNAIEKRSATSCNIDRGFEEAVTAHMATRSFKEGRRVRWDPGTETII